MVHFEELLAGTSHGPSTTSSGLGPSPAVAAVPCLSSSGASAPSRGPRPGAVRGRSKGHRAASPRCGSWGLCRWRFVCLMGGGAWEERLRLRGNASKRERHLMLRVPRWWSGRRSNSSLSRGPSVPTGGAPRSLCDGTWVYEAFLALRPPITVPLFTGRAGGFELWL